MTSRDRYRKLTDLFVTGDVIQPDPNGPPVWLQKLNAFEAEEARIHANARRALVVNTLREVGSDEMAALQRAIEDMAADVLIEGVVRARYSKHLAESAAKVAADPAWAESQVILDRVESYDSLEPEQKELIDKLNADYFTRVYSGVQERDEDARSELTNSDVTQLRKEYLDTFIEQRGVAVFTREHRVAEIVIGARMCDATANDLGSYDSADHSGCQHQPIYIDIPVLDDNDQQVLDSDGRPLVHTAYQQVRAEPDALFAAYVAGFDRINVPRATAKTLASRQNSSASSRPLNEGAASTPSTPEEVHSAPDGT